MKTIRLILVLLAPLLAHARLGEAITECDVRYGGGKPGTCSSEDRIKPLVTGDNTTNLTYIFKGFTVRVGFRNSKAVRLDIAQSGFSKLTDAQVGQFLDANSEGKPWYETSARTAAGLVADDSVIAKPDNEMRAWRRDDDRAVAALYNRGKSMRFVRIEPPPKNKKHKPDAGGKPAPPGPTTF